jgi:hypothetical protein
MASVRRLLGTLTFLVSVSAALSGQVLTTLVTFTGGNGSESRAPLIQGVDGFSQRKLASKTFTVIP